MEGTPVGELTSAGFSRKHGRIVALGYARGPAPLDEAALASAAFAIDLAGAHVRATARVL
jgi:glycine cleavage system aminomethyltransferase T